MFPLRKIFRFVPAIAVMAAIFWLSGTPAEPLMQTLDPIIDRAPNVVTVPVAEKSIPIEWLKVGHFVGYFLLGGALYYALEPLTSRPGGWSILIVMLYATSDEIHQMFVPGRHSGWTDVVLDTAAAAVAIGVVKVAIMERMRMRGKKLDRQLPDNAFNASGVK